MTRKRKHFHRSVLPPVLRPMMRPYVWLAAEEIKASSAYVCHYHRSLPLEAEIESETKRAEELLARLENIAEAEDYQVETDLLQAREVAPTIIDEAVERNIDLIFMGIKYHKRFGQFSLGSIVPYILKNAPCQVMLYSQYSA